MAFETIGRHVLYECIRLKGALLIQGWGGANKKRGKRFYIGICGAQFARVMRVRIITHTY